VSGTTPLVSVIVPAFNAAETIEHSLESLAAQSLRELEIVVVDDGSTDRTAELVRRFSEQLDPRVRLVSQEHSGRAAARNTGMRNASGGFLGFVDADDEALPGMFESLLRRAMSTGAEIVVGEYLGVDAATGEMFYRHTEGDSAVYGTNVERCPDLLVQPGASVCNKLFSADLFERTGIRFPTGLDFEDLATSYRLVGEASRIEKVPEVVYVYRQGQPASVMGACDNRFLQVVSALETTNQHFIDSGRFDRLYGQLERVNFTHLLSGRLDDLLRYGCHADRMAFIDVAFGHLDAYFSGWRRDAVVRESAGRGIRHWVMTHKTVLKRYSDYHAVRSR